MDINNQYLSLSIFNYLCKVVGSEDVVRARRGFFSALDFVCRGKRKSTIYNGSKAEGLDLNGSDFDFMFVEHELAVYENIDEIPCRNENKPPLPLIMDTNDTKPGYTLLKLPHRNIKHKFIVEIIIGRIFHDETFLSSKLLRELNMLDFTVVHGPCTSLNGIVDSVYSLHSSKWISQAEEWRCRPRLSWPNNRLIETVVQYGVCFVPVGCKNSPRKDLEFRISFNIAEKALVHSFNHVQLLCYALLKLILKDFIKPQYGDLLCSYLLKTIMFWISEESTESAWKPHNLLRCFDRCFQRLVYCVTYSTCLHYFIPDLDFFADRFSPSDHYLLTNTLHSLYYSGWQCVLQTDLFSSFLVQQSPTRLPYVSALPILPYLDCLIYRKFTSHAFSTFSVFSSSVLGLLTLPAKQMYSIILSRVNQGIAQSVLKNETCHVTNKQRYQNYRKCLTHLLLGLHNDSVSGWLLLASLLYTCKQYQQCLHVIRFCLHKCTPDKIYLLDIAINGDLHHGLQHEFNFEIEQHEKNGFIRTCQRRVCSLVRFEEKSSIIPAELTSFVMKNPHFFHPVLFCHFVHCICLHHLNRHIDKMNALRDLETTAKELFFTQNYRYSLIGLSLANVARRVLAE